jgi:hypothetical protein
MDQVPLFAYLDCPTPKGPFDSKLFDEFPGWKRVKSGRSAWVDDLALWVAGEGWIYF